MEPPLADEAALRQHANVLTVLADAHGLSDLGLGELAGELVATVASGRTYFDIARFEMDAANMLGLTVRVTPSEAAGARVRAPLVPPAAA